MRNPRRLRVLDSDPTTDPPPKVRPTAPPTVSVRGRKRVVASSSSEDETGLESIAACTQTSTTKAAAEAAEPPCVATSVSRAEHPKPDTSDSGHHVKRMRMQDRVRESLSCSNVSAERQEHARHCGQKPVHQGQCVRTECSGQRLDAHCGHQRRETEVALRKQNISGGSRRLQLADSDAETSEDDKDVNLTVQRSPVRTRSNRLAGSLEGQQDGDLECTKADLLADSGAETSGDDSDWMGQKEPAAGHSSCKHRTMTHLGTDDDPEIPSWEHDLSGRSRAGRAQDDEEALRAAFSHAPCTAAELRQLPSACFLHGQPVFDGQGRVNLHLLAGTFLQLASSPSTVDAEARHVGWLARRACSLGLVTDRELARGRINRRCHNPRRKRAAPGQKQRVVLAEEKELCFPTHAPQKKIDAGNDVSLFDEAEDDVRRFMRHKQTVMELRSLNSSRRARIASRESHRLDLHEVRDKVMAPSLSFDWEARHEEESEDDEGPSGLEVGAPVNSSNRDHRRTLLREQIHTTVSRLRARELVADSGGSTLQSSLETPEQGEQRDAAACGTAEPGEGRREDDEMDEMDEVVTATKLRRYRRMLPEDAEDSTAVLGHDKAMAALLPDRAGPPKTKRQTSLLELFQVDMGTCLGELSAATGADHTGKHDVDPLKTQDASAQDGNSVGGQAKAGAGNGRDLEHHDAQADAEAVACHNRLRRLPVATDCLHDLASSSTNAPGSNVEADSDSESESGSAYIDGDTDTELSQCSWMAKDDQNLDDDEYRSERRRVQLLRKRRIEALRRERRLRLEVEDVQDLGDDKKRALRLGIATMRNEERQRLKDIISHEATCTSGPVVVRPSLLGQRGGEEEEAAGLFCPVGTRTSKICFVHKLPGTSALYS